MQELSLLLGYARTFNDKIEVSLEGYYKTMDNLIEYKDGASFFDSLVLMEVKTCLIYILIHPYQKINL